MENEKFWAEFIEIYRSHSCLWDVKSKDYLNKHKRSASYEKLLKKLKEIKADATLEYLKKKINNMRTAFRRELKKVQDSKRTGAGGDIYEPTLGYYDLLLFTAQSEIGRKGQSTDEGEKDIEGTTVDTIDETEFEESRDATDIAPFSPEDEPEVQTVFEHNESTTPHTSRSSSQATFRSQKRGKLGIRAQKRSAEEKRQELINLAHNALTNTNEDKYCIAGRRLGYQLKVLEEKQRIIAEKLISDIMFYARMGKLREDAVVQCSSVSSSLQGSNIHTSTQSANHRLQTIHPQSQQYEYWQAPQEHIRYQSEPVLHESHVLKHVPSRQESSSDLAQFVRSYEPLE